MQLKTIYQSDFTKVEVEEEKLYLQITWLQQPTSKDFREQLKQVANIALTYHSTKALFDVRARAYLEIADQNWLMREIVPLFKEINLRFAYVVSLTTLEIMDVIRIQQAIQRNSHWKEDLKIEIFLHPEEAQAWLLR